ncbi:MAG: hypothetical protein ACI4VF_00625 [Lachnospirales bacterium]
MNKIYSYDNVEAMVDSIKSNKELINSMVKKAGDNDKEIRNKMKVYALEKKTFSKEQMNDYKLYVESLEDIENMFDSYNKEIDNIGGFKYVSVEMCNDNTSYEEIHKIFSKINTIQIKIMEMLCGILGRANMFLAAI